MTVALQRALERGARTALQYFPDRCDLLGATFIDGGTTGDTVALASAGSNIPCMSRPLNQQSPQAQFVIGGRAYVATHKLYLKRTRESLAITPDYRIKVRARNGRPDMIFERPVIVENSFDPLVTIAAILVQEGFG